MVRAFSLCAVCKEGVKNINCSKNDKRIVKAARIKYCMRGSKNSYIYQVSK